MLDTVFLYMSRQGMKPGTPVLRSLRLLDQVRERIRDLHYSLQAEKAYLYWVRFFIHRHGQGGTMRHPRDLGAAEVEAYLTMLAAERHAVFPPARCSGLTCHGSLV